MGEEIFDIAEDFYDLDHRLQEISREKIPFEKMVGRGVAKIFDSAFDRTEITKAFGEKGLIDYADLDYDPINFSKVMRSDTSHVLETSSGQAFTRSKRATIEAIEIQNRRASKSMGGLIVSLLAVRQLL